MLQQTHSRSGYASMMIMIFMIIFTLIFGISAFLQNKQIKMLRSGDTQGEIKPNISIIALSDKIRGEQAEIAETEERIALLKKATHAYDREIAALGEYYFRGYTDAEGNDKAAAFIGLNDRADGTPFTHHNQANKLIQHHYDILKMWEAHYGSAARQDTPNLKDATKKFRESTNDIISEGGEAEENIQSTIDRLNEDLDKLKERRSELEADYRNQWSIKQTRKGQLNGQIRRLLELELRWLKQLESDGQILQTGVNYNFIIANIGSKENVSAGMRFEVFSHEKGQYQRKGMCEVIKVDRTISTCRIVAEDDPKKNPIAIGDHIGNPVFDAHDPKTFVLAGEFKLFNKDDLEYFITKAGGKVSKTLKPGVDFLVASWRSEEAQDQAREYDVLALDEETLIKYLDTTFATKAAHK